MSKILVTSDTHGHVHALKQAMIQAGDFDCFVHLGDHVADVRAILPLLEARGVSVYQVRGNCDFRGAEAYREFHLHGQRIGLTHGHNQRVKYSMMGVSLFAEERQAEAILFGHTHIPCIEYSHTGRLLFNPGSLGEPRMARKPTFGLLIVNKERILPKIVQLDDTIQV